MGKAIILGEIMLRLSTDQGKDLKPVKLSTRITAVVKQMWPSH